MKANPGADPMEALKSAMMIVALPFAMVMLSLTKALEVMHKELDTTMALCGHRDINDVTRDILYIPEDFEGRWA